MLGRYLARAHLGGEPHTTQARVWLEKAKAQGLREAEADLGHPARCTAAGYGGARIRRAWMPAPTDRPPRT